MGCTPSSRRHTKHHHKNEIHSTAVVTESNGHIEEVMLKRASQHFTENIVAANLNRDIRDFYIVDNTEVLGTGVNGAVKACFHKTTKHKLNQLREEIKIMSQLDHPNIMRLEEYFENNDHVYLVMECCTGGELLDRLHQQKGHHYSEVVACKYVNTMLRAIAYCHSHKIVHRDLKLENFLFESKSPDAELKLIDFGLSQHFQPDVQLHKAVGTPYYVSPEVLAGNYDAKCDVWSIGVIAYMLLSGTPPFYGKDDHETLQSVKNGKWKFHDSLFSQISEQAKDFIRCCLTRNPVNRLSSSDLLDHAWFKLLSVPSLGNKISLDILSRLRGFEKRSSLSRLCMEVIAFSLHPDQIAELRKEFVKFDLHQTGEISHQDFKSVLLASGRFSDKDMNNIVNDVDVGHKGIINYHDFIAATLSRQAITDENVQVAFEKISKHGEFITASDLKDLMGRDASEKDIEHMLEEADLSTHDKISMDQFKSIMMGGPPTPALSAMSSTLPTPALSPSSGTITRKKFFDGESLIKKENPKEDLRGASRVVK